MTDNQNTTKVLRGTIKNLEVQETTVDAFQGDELRTRSGAAGALAAAAGLSGIAAGMVAVSMDEMREGAFGVSFEIDGQPVRGVLWDCPFKEGDEVEVVAEKTNGYWNAFAVARPKDRIISLFPHAVSGEIAHYRSSFSIWLKIWLALLLFGGVLGAIIKFLNSGNDGWGEWILFMIGGSGSVVFVILGIIGFSVARKYIPFVRVAEGVFTALGWQDVKRINLRKKTLKNIRPDDPPALGVFYFRY